MRYLKTFEELDSTPGNAPGPKQVHVFDFDDTLGVTSNPNGVMPYKDGQPMFKDESSAKDWVKKNGLEKDLLAPKDGPAIKKIEDRDGYAIYLSSAGLAKVQSKEKFPQYQPAKDKQIVVGSDKEGVAKQEGTGELLLIDFTPSSYVDPSTTKPIDSTINKLKQVNAKGGKTAVMTARQGTGAGKNLSGETVNATNAEDIKKFLASKGAEPNSGVIGVAGKNKGEEIVKKFSDLKPEEIHFYDDLSRNTDQVSAELSKQKDKEVYIYGPGEFAHGEADPNDPDKVLGGAEGKQATQEEEPKEATKESLQVKKFSTFIK